MNKNKKREREREREIPSKNYDAVNYAKLTRAYFIARCGERAKWRENARTSGVATAAATRACGRGNGGGVIRRALIVHSARGVGWWGCWGGRPQESQFGGASSRARAQSTLGTC